MLKIKALKTSSFLNRKLLLLLILVFSVVLLLISLPKVDLAGTPFEFSIETPKENAVLNYKQTFKIKVEDTEGSENIIFYWTVENSELENRMREIDGGLFVDHVNVDEWDWNRDHQYEINFIAKDSYGEIISQRAVTISTRPPAETTEVLIEDEVDITHSNLSASALSTTQEPLQPPQEESPPRKILSIKPSKIKYGEHAYNFVFESETYDPDQIMAFWKSEGGHNNLISEKNEAGQYQVNIDFSNWRWLNEGPYKMLFFILNRENNEELAKVGVSMFWEGSNDHRNLRFELGDQVVGNMIPERTAAPEASPVQMVTTKENVSQNISRQLKSESFVFSNFHVPEKPTVNSSIESTTNPSEKEALSYIHNQPWAIWLNNDEHESDEFLRGVMEEARLNETIPIFVLYNIPNRDCGSHSSGGADSSNRYREWVDRLSKVLDTTEVILIIEPDALPQLNCLNEEGRRERLDLIRYAVDSLAKLPLAHVYIDAGHPFWINPEEMAERLKAVNISSVSGFALNVSNFASTEDNIRYGDYLSFLTGNSYYVIDTGRNGNGPAPDHTWCNPRGRALGEASRLVKDRGALSALLWVKCPGESDGTCNGGPPAGHWWKDYAIELGINFLRSN